MNEYKKYPRTFHFPFSPKKTDDDKTLSNCDHFVGKEVVALVKIDGQNTSTYNNYIHTRSLNGISHPSMDGIKGYVSRFQHEIPDNMRLIFEDVSIVHTIEYSNLPTLYYLISIWEGDKCLSWDDTVYLSMILDLVTVPILYRGLWDENKIKSLYTPYFEGNRMEGYVVRLADSFTYSDFPKSVAKFVSKSFEIGNQHWSSGVLRKNQLIGKSDK